MTALVSFSTDDPTPIWFERRRHSLRRDSAGYMAFDHRLLGCADARLGFLQQPGRPAVQVYGSSVNLESTSGVTGTSVDGSTNRFIRTADPDDAAKWCWQFRLHPDDPDTASSKRAEFAFASTSQTNPRIPPRNDVVTGLCIRMQDWRSLTDDQLVFQVHGPDGGNVGNPWIALLVTDGVMRLSLRYDTNEVSDPGTVTILDLWTDNVWVPEQWYRFVFRTRADYTGNGVIEATRDGVMIASYNGPVGYNDDALGSSYVKSGYYHWIDSGNDWDTSVNTREVWHKGAYVADGRVSVSEMDDFLAEL